MNLTPHLASAALWAGLAATLAAAPATVLVDFGKNDLETTPATGGGAHWNNVSAGPDANGILTDEWLRENHPTRLLFSGVDNMYHNPPGQLPRPLVPDLVDAVGAATGAALVLVDVVDPDLGNSSGGLGRAGLEYADLFGAIPTATGYPATATIDSVYINFGHRAIFQVTGLNDAETYTLKFWGGQNSSTRRTKITLNGVSQIFETLNNTGANSGDYAIFSDIRPSGGAITFELAQGQNFIAGVTPLAENENGQLSVLEITGNFGAAPPTAVAARLQDGVLRFQTVAGQSYRVQFATELTPPNWADLVTGIAGDGAEAAVPIFGQAALAGRDRAFLRVLRP